MVNVDRDEDVVAANIDVTQDALHLLVVLLIEFDARDSALGDVAVLAVLILFCFEACPGFLGWRRWRRWFGQIRATKVQIAVRVHYDFLFLPSPSRSGNASIQLELYVGENGALLLMLDLFEDGPNLLIDRVHHGFPQFIVLEAILVCCKLSLEALAKVKPTGDA